MKRVVLDLGKDVAKVGNLLLKHTGLVAQDLHGFLNKC